MADDALAKLPSEFAHFLDDQGLVYDPATQIDLLSSALSSQFLIFAGPSGTGKSTAARVLGEFFGSTARAIDVRPGWSSIEDLVGQYSIFAETFVAGPAFSSLKELAAASQPSGTAHGVRAPIAIIEEANLSPIESYFGPLVTASSSLQFENLDIEYLTDVHSTARLRIGPWPRFFATVNIDSTAPAPAPKISGRACVVLLEPPSAELLLRAVGASEDLAGATTGPESGSVFLGDPRSALDALRVSQDFQWVSDNLTPLLELLAQTAGNGMNVVSPRDIQRATSYMGWHRSLAKAALKDELVEQYVEAESAENAILHFVLPGLSAEQFGRALNPLAEEATDRGLLRRRLSKLAIGGESLFGVAPDFWASLS